MVSVRSFWWFESYESFNGFVVCKLRNSLKQSTILESLPQNLLQITICVDCVLIVSRKKSFEFWSLPFEVWSVQRVSRIYSSLLAFRAATSFELFQIFEKRTLFWYLPKLSLPSNLVAVPSIVSTFAIQDVLLRNHRLLHGARVRHPQSGEGISLCVDHLPR